MVLENKLGITDPSAFAAAEERIVKLRARELFDRGLLGKVEIGTFKGLSTIHKYLYGDIYPFAGEVRTVDTAKGNVFFAPVKFIDTSIEFASIMPCSTFDEIAAKFIEMNIAHPFRTGNGVSMRIWLNIMTSAALGAAVDYAAIEKQAFLAAMNECTVNGSRLVRLLGGALTRDLGRDMYLRGIDASLAFEGYCAFGAASVR